MGTVPCIHQESQNYLKPVTVQYNTRNLPTVPYVPCKAVITVSTGVDAPKTRDWGTFKLMEKTNCCKIRNIYIYIIFTYTYILWRIWVENSDCFLLANWLPTQKSGISHSSPFCTTEWARLGGTSERNFSVFSFLIIQNKTNLTPSRCEINANQPLILFRRRAINPQINQCSSQMRRDDHSLAWKPALLLVSSILLNTLKTMAKKQIPDKTSSGWEPPQGQRSWHWFAPRSFRIPVSVNMG